MSTAGSEGRLSFKSDHLSQKGMGFLIVNVVTNGTFPLDLPEADLILLSLGGRLHLSVRMMVPRMGSCFLSRMARRPMFESDIPQSPDTLPGKEQQEEQDRRSGTDRCPAAPRP